MPRAANRLLLAAWVLLGPGMARAEPVVQAGRADLSETRLEVDGPVRLDGAWDFAPGVALGPGDPWPEGAGALQVPGSWSKKSVGGVTQPISGVGTYRLRLRLPRERPRELGLRLAGVNSAFTLSVDGRWVSGNGRVALTKSETEARVHPLTTSFTAAGDETEIRIAVANYHHRKGGVRRPVYVGTSEQLQLGARWRIAFDAVVAALALIIGFHHFFLWGLRRRDLTNLAFSLFALTMGGRALLVGEGVLPGLVWTEMPYDARIALEYLTMNLGVPLLWWIMREMFPEEVPRWVCVIAWALALPLMLLVLVTPATVFTYTAVASRALIGLSIPVAIFALLRAAQRGREGAGLILVGQLMLSAAVGHDILLHTGMVPTDIELGTLGFVGLLGCQALVLTQRFSRSFDRVEALSRELSAAHGYNESILFSLRSGVLTFDTEGRVAKANLAAARILGVDGELPGRDAATLFEANGWVLENMRRVDLRGAAVHSDNRELAGADDDEPVWANVSVAPLVDTEGASLGQLMLIDDVSHERRMKATMARYMSREVADRLLEGGAAALGGQLSQATVLFSDIRKFSTVAEGLGPTGTVQMLNEYFTIMVDEVFRHEGILDKYIGDAIMAVFGSIGSDEHHARRAVECAVGMLRLSGELNRVRVERGDVAINIGIGLNTDEIVHGNIGSPRRMDYTVIGDGVNLAARLESANVTYGTQLLVSEFTLAALSDDDRAAVAHRELDLVAVKGKTQAVRVYEILEHRSDDVRPLCEGFGDALSLYRARDWTAASTAFRILASRFADDGPSRLYVDRCAHFSANPPPQDWDGVWRMKTK